MNNKKAIIVLGAPGAGKGTQANLLAEKFDLYHLETSKILEERSANFKQGQFIEAGGRKYYFEEEKKRRDSGELNSPPFVFALIEEAVREKIRLEKGLVFSGSPRTLLETEKLMPLLEGLCGKENIKTFFLDLDVETSVWRNSNRRVCGLMNHSILFNKETENLSICPLDGSKLIKRQLDVIETIKTRFQVFERDTLPLIDYLKTNGFHFQEIDGRPSVSDVFNEILKHLTP